MRATSHGRLLGSWAALTVAVAPALASSATILPPVFGPYQMVQPIAATVRASGVQRAANSSLYDGTGLTHRNPILAQHGSDPATIWQMPLEESGFPISLEFDLGKEFLVSEMWVWQLRGDGMEDWGISEFELVMRDGSGREVGQLSGNSASLKGVGLQPVERFNAFGECVFLPIPDCVRYIELRILSNLGSPDWVGLAEVSFAGREKVAAVPEPSAWPGIALGALGLVSGRRCRQRRKRRPR